MYTIASKFSRLELGFIRHGDESCTVILSGPGVRAEAMVEIMDPEAYDHPSWFFQSIARHAEPWADVESYSHDFVDIVAECSPAGIVTLLVTLRGMTGAETWTVSAPVTVELGQLQAIARGILVS